MAAGRNFPMSGINSGHHYLPTYQILMMWDNVEFLPPIFMPCFGSHFENGRSAPLMGTYHYEEIFKSPKQSLGDLLFLLRFLVLL
jgi:hypothetical protein